MNTSTTPKVEYSYANGSANTIRMTYQQRGTFQQQWGLDAVGWTFLSVDSAVIDWAIEDSTNSDKNVQATGNMVGIPNPPATTTGTTPAWNPFTESQWNSFTEAQWNAFTLDSGTVPTQLSARYDAWNRLVEIRNGATTLVENVYDARGYRIRKDTYTSGTLSEARHYYYTPGWQCVEERIGSTSTAERQFVWGLRYIDDLILRDRSTANNGTMNERRYGMQDGNWNVTAISDTTGAVTERFAYSAYGAPVFMTGAGTVQTSSASGFETLYAGYRWDGESPLMYYVRNRFLLPVIGTWNRRDPLKYVDGMGLYNYQPSINRTDPDGRLTKCECNKYNGRVTPPLHEFRFTATDLNCRIVCGCGDEETFCSGTKVPLTPDERQVVALCNGDPKCEGSIATLMNRVLRTTSGVIAPHWPFIDEDGYCFEYLKNFRSCCEGWNGNKQGLPGGCTVELMQVSVRPSKANPKTGNLTLYRNYWFGYETIGFSDHGIGKVCCGEGNDKKCMYFDVGSESFTGQYGENDKWFSVDDINFVDEIDPNSEMPWNP